MNGKLSIHGEIRPKGLALGLGKAAEILLVKKDSRLIWLTGESAVGRFGAASGDA
jgi:hypothetical protein